MPDNNVENKGNGRIGNIWKAFTNILKDNPLLALITAVILFPLGALITSKVAVEGDIGGTVPIIVLMCLIICLVCIPLIIVNVWKKNQETIAKDRSGVIKTEANRRIIIEESKQKRFHEVMDKKINVLQAQQDYILSQSDRHERHVLKETAAKLNETITKSFEFVEEKTCSSNVSQILQELAKHEVQFDKVLESVESIQTKLNVQKEEEPPIEVNDKVADPDETNWKGVAEVRQKFIEEQQKEIEEKEEEIKEIIFNKEKEIDNLKNRNEQQYKRLSELEPGPIPTLFQDDIDLPVSEIIESSEPLDELRLQDNHLNLSLKEEDLTSNDAKPMEKYGKQQDFTPLAKAEPLPKNYWTCTRCDTKNPLKKPRCKNCTLSKAAIID